jgi:hypothetical protein
MPIVGFDYFTVEYSTIENCLSGVKDLLERDDIVSIDISFDFTPDLVYVVKYQIIRIREFNTKVS